MVYAFGLFPPTKPIPFILSKCLPLARPPGYAKSTIQKPIFSGERSTSLCRVWRFGKLFEELRISINSIRIGVNKAIDLSTPILRVLRSTHHFLTSARVVKILLISLKFTLRRMKISPVNNLDVKPWLLPSPALESKQVLQNAPQSTLQINYTKMYCTTSLYGI